MFRDPLRHLSPLFHPPSTVNARRLSELAAVHDNVENADASHSQSSQRWLPKTNLFMRSLAVFQSKSRLCVRIASLNPVRDRLRHHRHYDMLSPDGLSCFLETVRAQLPLHGLRLTRSCVLSPSFVIAMYCPKMVTV